jgi:ribosomal protein L11 methyltransferase
MNKGNFWQVCARTNATGEAAVTEVLEKFFQQPTCTYADAETGTVEVSVYVFARDECSPARMKRLKLQLGDYASGWTGGLRVRRVRQQDWAESWKRHFKPLDIAGRLLVKPSWSKRRPKAGQIAITLDPGLSFGTGHHPTTSFCLSELVRTRKPDTRQSALDIGTGSGLLAITAAKLGYAPVMAFDNDPEAVRVAKENLAVNEVSAAISISRKGLESLRPRPARRFDVVCANLLAELLIEQRARIAGQVAPGGRLVVAGILSRQFNAVRKAYVEMGLRLVRSRHENEWRSGTFAR